MLFTKKSISLFGGFDWMSNKCLLLSTFCTFQTPLTLLTNSALYLWQFEYLNLLLNKLFLMCDLILLFCEFTKVTWTDKYILRCCTDCRIMIFLKLSSFFFLGYKCCCHCVKMTMPSSTMVSESSQQSPWAADKPRIKSFRFERNMFPGICTLKPI